MIAIALFRHNILNISRYRAFSSKIVSNYLLSISNRYFEFDILLINFIKTTHRNEPEWNYALPYNKIPGPSIWSMIVQFLPGGKCEYIIKLLDA